MEEERQIQGNVYQLPFPVIIGGLLLTLVICSFPNYNYFTDNLVDAYAIETSVNWLVHPHHPLYPLAPQAIFRLLGGLRSGITSLGLMHVLSISFGVIGLWLMIFMLRVTGASNTMILAGASIYGLSNGVWYFNTVPNQNILALMLHLLTLLVIIVTSMRAPGGTPPGRIITIGILTSLAILSSTLNLILVLPAIYLLLIRASNGPRWKNLVVYLVSLVVVWGGLWSFLNYGLKGSGASEVFQDWRYSGLLSPRYWAGDLLDSLQRTWHGATELHLSNLWEDGSLFSRWDGEFRSIPLRLGQMIVLLFLIIETIRGILFWITSRPRPVIQNIAIITGLPVFLFYLVFTPELLNYRILYIPSFILFISFIMERDFGLRRPSIRKAWPLALVIISLFLTNFTLKFLPESNPDNNPYIIEAKQLGADYGLHDRIIYLSAMDNDYRIKHTQYFTQCNVTRVIELVAALRANPEEVEAFFRDGIKDGGKVLVHEDVLFSQECYAWINKKHGTDIQPLEVAAFFNSNFRVTDEFHAEREEIFRNGTGRRLRQSRSS